MVSEAFNHASQMAQGTHFKLRAQGPPKFLHSNATSHKWALGAFAELLDNSLDEICNGATYVNVDILQNKRDGNKMLLIEDNGGGMDPEKMRQCMSLGLQLISLICEFDNQLIYKEHWIDLMDMFNFLKENGMRIIIYNLWEDDSGQLELDFDTDQQDIHIRGVNRDEKNIQMAKQFPNSRHFLTYRHSLRPFWRLWNAAGSDGRGVIGVLEADFVEPAHDKQGFERTIVLSRLETRLQQMQKTYWTTYCHKIGYAPRGNKKLINESVRETPPDHLPKTSSLLKMKVSASSSSKTPQASHSNQKQGGGELERTPETVDQGYGNGNGHSFSKQEKTTNMSTQLRRDQSSLDYELKERLKRKEGDIVVALQHDLEKERGKCRLLETQLQEAIQTIEERNKEQDSLIETFSEERERRDIEEANLRKKLKDASNIIQELLAKVNPGSKSVHRKFCELTQIYGFRLRKAASDFGGSPLLQSYRHRCPG
ncbi:hypothetical protein VitviT2T_019734 [Vitis vinifera]|uniref:Morc S5 domain-containing protein n=1 Tax=Vitis vinifera TaxID=29760 RepID=A0ABY9D3D7_VITVI|nr:hypothetical protein VitviT2T_019734 [Vitis vinifera]